MKARILEQWDMKLPEPTSQAWFLDWVLRSPTQAGHHLACLYRALEAVASDVTYPRSITSVWEPFGGIGAAALMVEKFFPTMDHLVSDIAPAAVEHLNRVLPIGINVEQADAYSGEVYEADLAILDFGDLTVWKAQPDKERGRLLDAVFAQEPMAVTVTDVAARYLHLQKKSYEPILGKGTCDSYEQYLRTFADHLEDRYGYLLHEAHYTHWSGVMAFIPADLRNIHSGRIYKLPTDYPGLVLS